jgi:class 3 adenylate cyclase
MTSREQRDYTILVTDLEDFTGFKEDHGDEPADEVLVIHDSIVENAITKCGGKVLKSTGDGFVSYFDTAAWAIVAAVRIQQDLYKYNQSAELRIPQVRIGLSTGKVITRVGARQPDMLGGTVDKTFRICGMANGGHIFMESRPEEKLNRERKGNKLYRDILEDIHFLPKESAHWKGGRGDEVSVTEVNYKKSGSWLPPQDYIFFGPEVIYDKRKAVRTAIVMINSAKKRLLVALRTLPLVTGPNESLPESDYNGDKDLAAAIKARITGIQNETDTLESLCLVYSVMDSKRYLQKVRKKVPIESNIEEILRVRKDTGEKVQLLRTRSLQNDVVISDNTLAIWNLFGGKSSKKGFGVRMISADYSPSFWKYVLAICEPQNDDGSQLADELA